MKRRGALAAVVVAVAMTAAACGGGGGGDGANGAAVSIKTLQAAASNSQAAESSRFTMDMSVDVAGQPTTITASGLIAADGKNGELKIEMPIVGSMEERIVDGVIYMNLGSFAGVSGELGGKQWVKLDPAQLKGNSMFGDLAGQAESNSPKTGLEYLQGLSGDVQDLGQEDVNGQPATHYRASIDYTKLLAQLPDATQEQRDVLAKLGTVPADVWIDGQDRVVKMHLTMDASSFGAGAGTAELTMQLSDFGVPVDVQAPPPDQTADFSELGSLKV